MKLSECTDDIAAIYDALNRRDSERVGLLALESLEQKIEESSRRCHTAQPPRRADWVALKGERDEGDSLTPLALAVGAIDGAGCDCGTDEPGTCLACRCEAAIRGLLLDLAVIRQAADGLLVLMPDPTWGKSADETAIAVAQTLLAEVVYRESGR